MTSTAMGRRKAAKDGCCCDCLFFRPTENNDKIGRCRFRNDDGWLPITPPLEPHMVRDVDWCTQFRVVKSEMIIACCECGKITGSKPCSKEQSGHVSHTICDWCSEKMADSEIAEHGKSAGQSSRIHDVAALGEAMDAVDSPSEPEQVNAFLMDRGYDPDDVGRQIAALADMLMSGGRCEMIVACCECGKITGSKPCRPDQTGYISRIICDWCAEKMADSEIAEHGKSAGQSSRIHDTGSPSALDWEELYSICGGPPTTAQKLLFEKTFSEGKGELP